MIFFLFVFFFFKTGIAKEADFPLMFTIHKIAFENGNIEKDLVGVTSQNLKNANVNTFEKWDPKCQQLCGHLIGTVGFAAGMDLKKEKILSKITFEFEIINLYSYEYFYTVQSFYLQVYVMV